MDAPNSATMRVAGVMTGTSADGVDLVVCRIGGRAPDLQVELLAHHTMPLPDKVAALTRLAATEGLDGPAWALLEQRLSGAIADLAATARADTPFELIGVHGQTIWHRPPPADPAATVQVLDPWPIAIATGVPVVYDFRRADIAAGGQGAPLAPLAHAAIFGPRLPPGSAVLNVGGIANLSLLEQAADPAGVRAWDCGPGMLVSDALARRLLDRPMDTDGQIAARGRVHPELVERGLQHPFFGLPLPRSTGREDFGEPFVDEWLRAAPADASTADLLRSALALSAAGVRAGLPDDPAVLVVVGGGARNPSLLDELRRRLPNTQVTPSTAFGWAPETIEGAAFALLAHARWHGLPGNLPRVTGARHPLPLGAIALPPSGPPAPGADDTA